MGLKKLLFTVSVFFSFLLNCYADSRVFFENFDDGNANEFDSVRGSVVSNYSYSGNFCGRGAWNDSNPEDFVINNFQYEKELFLRFWIRVDSNCEPEEGAKFLRLGFDGGNTDTYHEINTGNGSIHAPWFTDGIMVLNAYSGNIGIGEWTKYEVYIKHDTNNSDGIFRVWINDELVPKYDQLLVDSFDDEEKWYPIHLPSNWVHRGENPNYVYFDDVEVFSDQGTGAVGEMENGTIKASDNEEEVNDNSVSAIKPSRASVVTWDSTKQMGTETWYNSNTNWCVRFKIDGSYIEKSGQNLIVALRGRDSNAYSIKKMSIAEKDSIGEVGDIIDSTWTRITFDGNSVSTWSSDEVVVAENTIKRSDTIPFEIQKGKDYYVTFQILTPGVYKLVSENVGNELYFDSDDFSDTLDWSGSGFKEYQGALHAIDNIAIIQE
jgi:hypothetical protein